MVYADQRIGNGTITVNAAENTAAQTRTTTITVTAGALTRTVTLTQAAAATPQGVVTFTVTPVDNTVTFYASAQKLIVDWGDGNSNTYNNVTVNTEITHNYSNITARTVTIYEEGLTYFNCGGTAYNNLVNLTTLNVTNCSALQTLTCYYGNLASLNINGCTALEYLYCNNNKLTSLNVSGCIALQYLYCYLNQLTILNVSGLTALKILYCGTSNTLTSLDVSGCAALQELNCSYSALSSLDVSGCISLQKLDCRMNELTSLDVSNFTALTTLYCAYNQLTSLNINGCTALQGQLQCYHNQLNTSALNTVLTDLPDYSGTSTSSIVYIGTNPGTTTCDTSIATAKNWDVNSN